MSAGTGVRHAEYNREDERTTIFQIWIEPSAKGLPPRWDQKAFPKDDRAGELTPLASGRPGHEGALPITQDAAVLAPRSTPGSRSRTGWSRAGRPTSWARWAGSR
jgi:redox-sensitive bicupin YhaK (pirin superfamily)